MIRLLLNKMLPLFFILLIFAIIITLFAFSFMLLPLASFLRIRIHSHLALLQFHTFLLASTLLAMDDWLLAVSLG